MSIHSPCYFYIALNVGVEWHPNAREGRERFFIQHTSQDSLNLVHHTQMHGITFVYALFIFGSYPAMSVHEVQKSTQLIQSNQNQYMDK